MKTCASCELVCDHVRAATAENALAVDATTTQRLPLNHQVYAVESSSYCAASDLVLASQAVYVTCCANGFLQTVQRTAARGAASACMVQQYIYSTAQTCRQWISCHSGPVVVMHLVDRISVCVPYIYDEIQDRFPAGRNGEKLGTRATLACPSKVLTGLDRWYHV